MSNKRIMLTKEQVLALKPGREMDALIAEHVFKWRKVPGPKTDYDGQCESFDVLVPPGIEDPFPLYPPKGVIKPYWFCNQWSVFPDEAWEVFEQFMEGRIIRKRGAGYKCGVLPHFGGNGVTKWSFAAGNDLAEVICKAALLAEAVMWDD